MKDDGRVAYISSAYAMRRSDKQPDRVEIHPEQLSAAAMEAEQQATRLRRPIQVTLVCLLIPSVPPFPNLSIFPISV